MACQGGTDDALEQRAKAVALRPEIDSSVALHELLAENFAKAGRSDDAIRWAEHALNLARASSNNEALRRINARLQRYKTNNPPAR